MLKVFYLVQFLVDLEVRLHVLHCQVSVDPLQATDQKQVLSHEFIHFDEEDLLGFLIDQTEP